MFSTRLTQVAVCLGLLLSVQARAASPGTEKRCADLGASCRCSEPMDVNDGSSVGLVWADPSDSPDATECSGNSGAVNGTFLMMASSGNASQVNPIPNPDLNYGGTNPPTNAIELLGSYTLLIDKHNAPPNSQRWCVRWYERFGYNMIPSGGDSCTGNNGGKILDFDSNLATSNQWWHEIPSYCPARSPVNPSDWRGTAVALRNVGDTLHPLTPGHPTWNMSKCRKGADGTNGWCRFEFCGAGTLNTGGSRYYEARIMALDDKAVQQVTTPTRSHSGPMEAHFNSWPGNGGGSYGEAVRREIAYYMEASWSTDLDQWIGPASEIEGSGGGSTSPPPPSAPPAPVLLP